MYISKAKMGWIIFAIFMLVAVVAFFVTSVVLADIHEVSLVTEWQTWFGIVKKAVDNPPNEVVKTAKIVILKPFKALIAC